MFCSVEIPLSGGTLTMKEVAARWAALSPTCKEDYRQKSKAEFAALEAFGFQAQGKEAKGKVAKPPIAIHPSNETNTGGGSVPSAGSVPGSSADAHAVKFGIYTLVQGVPALGKGSYGQVFRVADPTGHVLAAKVFKDAVECSREVTAYRKIASARLHGTACPAHFLELMDFAATALLSWIVFPIAEGGCLGKHMSEAARSHRGRFPVAEAHEIMEQAWIALHFLHMVAGILHMGMKPNNMVWSRAHERLVVVDFLWSSRGLSRQGTSRMASIAHCPTGPQRSWRKSSGQRCWHMCGQPLICGLSGVSFMSWPPAMHGSVAKQRISTCMSSAFTISNWVGFRRH